MNSLFSLQLVSFYNEVLSLLFRSLLKRKCVIIIIIIFLLFTLISPGLKTYFTIEYWQQHI